MGIKRKYLRMILIGGIAATLTACGSQGSNTETKVYALDIDGEKIYYAEESQDVLEIKAVAEGFLNVAVGKDYNNPDARAEQEYYIQTIKEANLANNIPEKSKQSTIDNKLMVLVDRSDMNNIRFVKAEGKDRALVNCTYISTIQNAVDAYLERIQVEKGVPYSRTIEFQMEKEEGSWKIVDYTLGKREKV